MSLSAHSMELLLIINWDVCEEHKRLHLKADPSSWQLGEPRALPPPLPLGKLWNMYTELWADHKTPINFISMGAAPCFSSSPWQQGLLESDPFDHPYILTIFSYKTQSQSSGVESVGIHWPCCHLRPLSVSFLLNSLSQQAGLVCLVLGFLALSALMGHFEYIHGPFTKQGVYWLLSHNIWNILLVMYSM